jgi:hypothetical protein
VAHTDTVDAPVVGAQGHRPGAVPDFDAVCKGATRQRAHQTRAAARRLDDQIPPEREAAVDLDGLSAIDGQEPHALAAHPPQRLEAPINEDLSEVGIAAMFGYAGDVIEERRGRVVPEIGSAELLIGDLVDQLDQVGGAVVRDTHGAGRERRVAARLLLWGAFEDQHRGSGVARRQRRTQAGVPAANDDDVETLCHQRHPGMRRYSCASSMASIRKGRSVAAARLTASAYSAVVSTRTPSIPKVAASAQ